MKFITEKEVRPTTINHPEILVPQTCFCLRPLLALFPLSGLLISRYKCHLQERLSCHPKLLGNSPHHTLPLYPILFLVTEFTMTWKHIKCLLVYIPPTKMWVSWVQGSLLLVSSAKEQWLEHLFSECQMLYIELSNEDATMNKKTRFLSSWNLHSNEEDNQ